MLGQYNTGGLWIVMPKPYDLDYKCLEDMIYSFQTF